MKKKISIPCLPGWLAALFFGILALVPTYGYLRLIALGLKGGLENETAFLHGDLLMHDFFDHYSIE